jgi:hypothetical protein
MGAGPRVGKIAADVHPKAPLRLLHTMFADESPQFAERCAEASCRVSGVKGLAPVLDLGEMPASAALLSRAQLDAGTERRYPLALGFSPASGLVQVVETVKPEVLFGRDNLCYSGDDPALVRGAREAALAMIQQRGLGRETLVVELGSNDGTLLRTCVERGIPVLGVEPAPGQAAAARDLGVATRGAFFTETLARELAAEGVRAEVVLATHVLDCAADPVGFLRGIGAILSPGGTAIVDVHSARDLVERGGFDSIDHRRASVFSVLSAAGLFERGGLVLRRVEPSPIGAGSLRFFAGKGGADDGSVALALEHERGLGMDTPAFYRPLAESARRTVDALRSMLDDLRSRGHRVAAYGAGPGAAVLLNACDAGTDLVEFVVDPRARTHGRFMPGTHQPVLPPGELAARRAAYVLLLARNERDEVLAEQDALRRAGGRFIVPSVDPEVV